MKQTVSDAVVLECELPEPRAKVWRALTKKELLAAWLQLEPDTECEVLEAQEGRTLRWRQREPADAVSHQFVESVVSIELSDLPDGGTRLRVVHDGFTAVTATTNVLRMAA